MGDINNMVEKAAKTTFCWRWHKPMNIQLLLPAHEEPMNEQGSRKWLRHRLIMKFIGPLCQSCKQSCCCLCNGLVGGDPIKRRHSFTKLLFLYSDGHSLTHWHGSHQPGNCSNKVWCSLRKTKAKVLGCNSKGREINQSFRKVSKRTLCKPSGK